MYKSPHLAFTSTAELLAASDADLICNVRPQFCMLVQF